MPAHTTRKEWIAKSPESPRAMPTANRTHSYANATALNLPHTCSHTHIYVYTKRNSSRMRYDRHILQNLNGRWTSDGGSSLLGSDKPTRWFWRVDASEMRFATTLNRTIRWWGWDFLCVCLNSCACKLTCECIILYNTLCLFLNITTWIFVICTKYLNTYIFDYANIGTQ